MPLSGGAGDVSHPLNITSFSLDRAGSVISLPGVFVYIVAMVAMFDV